jgi:hypothetical protein
MPNIDDPIEQARSQWISGGEPFANALTQEAFKKGFPILGSVFSFWKSAEQKRVLVEFNNWVLDYLKQLDQRVDNLPDQITPELDRIAALAVERILWGASIKKAKQFAAVFASQFTAPDDTQALEDAASFIRALDELSESDIKTLNHLYSYQKDCFSGRVDYNKFFEDNKMRRMLDSVNKLGIEMDDFYARCSRLTGYGLALPLDKSHGSMGDPNQFAFRITLLGKRLVELLALSETDTVQTGQVEG